ncbi:hypothetical protein [Reyranella sp.]|uniref:hypothetical protein n=1 Tax=Reyranella sp. TaxID=1929291 RepID=UPI0011FBE506|nr:hypothetical protein [Reyranella sp.]TAJ82107.1 MAG: hypothetical protein EPO50_27830 [Reyranella sp.]
MAFGVPTSNVDVARAQTAREIRFQGDEMLSGSRTRKRVAKSTLVEWQSGRLELGKVIREGRSWSVDDPNSLYWYGFDEEVFVVRDFVGADRLFDGREAVARLERPARKGLLPRLVCFVEFTSHYVTNADEEECRSILNGAYSAFDSSKPVLCGGWDEDSISVMPVRSIDPHWISAVYKPTVEEVDLSADVADPDVRTRVRGARAARKVAVDQFVLDPLEGQKGASCYALVSQDGELSEFTNGWSSSGIVATPSAEILEELRKLMISSKPPA